MTTYPYMLKPGETLTDPDMTPPAGYEGPAVVVEDAWQATKPAAIVGGRIDGFNTAVDFRGHVDRFHLDRTEIGNTVIGLNMANTVVRESFFTNLSIHDTKLGCAINALGTTGDATNQLTFLGWHGSYVDQHFTITGRDDRPVRRIRVIGAQIHGPQDKNKTKDLVSLIGNVRDVTFDDVDFNNGSKDAALVRALPSPGHRVPTGIKITNFSTANTAGDGFIFHDGRNILIDGHFDGINGNNLHVDPNVHNLVDRTW